MFGPRLVCALSIGLAVAGVPDCDAEQVAADPVVAFDGILDQEVAILEALQSGDEQRILRAYRKSERICTDFLKRFAKTEEAADVRSILKSNRQEMRRLAALVKREQEQMDSILAKVRPRIDVATAPRVRTASQRYPRLSGVSPSQQIEPDPGLARALRTAGMLDRVPAVLAPQSMAVASVPAGLELAAALPAGGLPLRAAAIDTRIPGLNTLQTWFPPHRSVAQLRVPVLALDVGLPTPGPAQQPVSAQRMVASACIMGFEELFAQLREQDAETIGEDVLTGLVDWGWLALEMERGMGSIVRQWVKTRASQKGRSGPEPEPPADAGLIVMGAPNVADTSREAGPNGVPVWAVRVFLSLVTHHPEHPWPTSFVAPLIDEARSRSGDLPPGALTAVFASYAREASTALTSDSTTDAAALQRRRALFQAIAQAALEERAYPQALAIYDVLLPNVPEGFPRGRTGADLMLRLAALHLERRVGHAHQRAAPSKAGEAYPARGGAMAARYCLAAMKNFGRGQRIEWQPTLGRVGSALEESGDPRAAIEFWRAVFEHVPHGSEESLAARRLASLYKAQDAEPEAKGILDEFTARARINPHKLLEAATLYRLIGSTDGALTAYRQFLDRFPAGDGAARARLAAAELLKESGDLAAAEQAYRSIHRAHPDTLPTAALGLRVAQLRLEASDDDGFVRECLTLVERHPSTDEAREALSMLGNWSAKHELALGLLAPAEPASHVPVASAPPHVRSRLREHVQVLRGEISTLLPNATRAYRVVLPPVEIRTIVHFPIPVAHPRARESVRAAVSQIYGDALAQRGRLADALKHYASAMEAAPGSLAARTAGQRSIALAAKGEGAQALGLACPTQTAISDTTQISLARLEQSSRRILGRLAPVAPVTFRAYYGQAGDGVATLAKLAAPIPPTIALAPSPKPLVAGLRPSSLNPDLKWTKRFEAVLERQLRAADRRQ